MQTTTFQMNPAQLEAAQSLFLVMTAYFPFLHEKVSALMGKAFAAPAVYIDQLQKNCGIYANAIHIRDTDFLLNFLSAHLELSEAQTRLVTLNLTQNQGLKEHIFRLLDTLVKTNI